MALLPLAVVLLRVLAIVLVVGGIEQAASLWPMMSWNELNNPGSTMTWTTVLGWILVATVRLVAAAILLFRTEPVARFVCRGQPAAGPVSLEARELVVVGFSITGLYCLVLGLPSVLWNALSHRSLKQDFLNSHSVRDVALLVIGLLLFVTPQGFVRIAGWLRRAGAPEPPAHPPA